MLHIQVVGVVEQSQARQTREKCFLIRLCVAILMLGLFGQGIHWSEPAADAAEAEAQIKILSPSPGAVIKGDSVEVRYELAKGVHATHVHCYVDGEYQRGFSGVVKGLTRGTHEIKIVAASHDHEAMAAEARVTIEVE